MERTSLTGVHVYAATPFRDDDLMSVDLDGLASNLAFQLDQGVRVIAVAGGTGEVDALAEAEITAVVRCAADVLGQRAALLAGLPANVAAAVRTAEHCEAAGVRALVPMAPLLRGRPASADGVVGYYRRLAGATGLPLMAYNQQSWPLEVFERLADIPSVIGIKVLRVRTFVTGGDGRMRSMTLRGRLRPGLAWLRAGCRAVTACGRVGRCRR